MRASLARVRDIRSVTVSPRSGESRTSFAMKSLRYGSSVTEQLESGTDHVVSMSACGIGFGVTRAFRRAMDAVAKRSRWKHAEAVIEGVG